VAKEYQANKEQMETINSFGKPVGKREELFSLMNAG